MLYVIINMLENQNILAKNQKLLKKNFITKKKKNQLLEKTLNGLNIIIKLTEERISELEGRSVEIIQSKQEKKERNPKTQKINKKSNAQVSTIHGVAKSQKQLRN